MRQPGRARAPAGHVPARTRRQGIRPMSEPATATFAAIDLGAASGRVMTAAVGRDRLELTEVRRFPNRPVRVAGTLHWDILGLYGNILDGLRAAAGTGPIASIGVDSWGVDFGLLDRSGALVGNPVHYRDGRTEGIMESVVAEIG